MIKNTAKVIGILTILCICLGSAALAAGETIVNDNFNDITEDTDVKTLSGWRVVNDYDLTTLFKATAKDDAMHLTYGTRTSTWASIGTKFYRDLPDYGEGVYEISYRFKAENFTNKIPALFNLYGYEINGDARKEKCLIFGTFGDLQFSNGKGVILQADSGCPRTEDKWIDFKYIVDTMGNKATVSYMIEGEDKVSVSGPIGPSNGLAHLYLEMQFGTDAKKDTPDHTAAMKGEYYFDDVKVIYHTTPTVSDTLPLEGANDVDNVDTTVELNFNMPMDEESLSTDSILVYEGDNTEPISKNAYEVQCSTNDLGNTVAMVEFLIDLPFNTDYTVKVVKGKVVSEEYGLNSVKDFELKFTTKPEAYVTAISVIDGESAPVGNLASMVGKTITVDMTIKAHYESSPYIAIVTIEDADGAMLMIANAQGTVDTVDASSFKPTFTVPENAKTIRAFLWKDYAAALPLAADAVFVGE